MKIIFISLASEGNGISGGDRIYIEFAKRWSENISVKIYSWKEGIEMMKRNALINNKTNVSITDIKMPVRSGFPWLVNYIIRIVFSIAFFSREKINFEPDTLVYSSSEFWMDSLSSILIKIRYPKIKLVSTWYQTAPNPITGYTLGRYKFSAFKYWISQLPIKKLINRFADIVLVNNELEKSVFPDKKTIVVLGAVNTNSIDKYISSHKKDVKIFDAVFQGRFHPQKGVEELVIIWKRVVEIRKNAKLCMIGDGPLMNKVTSMVRELGLQNSVIIKGYVFDGVEKYKIFNSSRLVVHPSLYDSGGMASAEAMAFGLPCVGFDLESYKSYYPEGMIRVKHGDLEGFAKTITEFLDNEKKLKKIGQDASNSIHKEFSWDTRSEKILKQIYE